MQNIMLLQGNTLYHSEGCYCKRNTVEQQYMMRKGSCHTLHGLTSRRTSWFAKRSIAGRDALHVTMCFKNKLIYLLQGFVGEQANSATLLS